MPELVEKTIKVSELRKDDVIVQPLVGSAHEAPYVVHSVERKVSWSYITLEDGGKPLRWRSDDDVRVQRSQPTDDERAALMREIMVESLRKALRGYLLRSPIHEVEVIVGKFQVNENNGTMLDYHNLGDVLQSQALYKQGVRIRASIHQLSDKAAIDAGGDWSKAVDVDSPDAVMAVDADVLLDAFASWYHEHYDVERHYSTLNPLSRSTSILSNLLEDLDRWAVEKVFTDVVWAQAGDELRRRVALAKAARKQQG